MFYLVDSLIKVMEFLSVVCRKDNSESFLLFIYVTRGFTFNTTVGYYRSKNNFMSVFLVPLINLVFLNRNSLFNNH